MGSESPGDPPNTPGDCSAESQDSLVKELVLSTAIICQGADNVKGIPAPVLFLSGPCNPPLEPCGKWYG